MHRILCIVAASCLASAGRAQEPVPPGQGRLQFAVSVETVTLDVVVADKKGRFIPGLKQENFEVLEDGVPQEVAFFTAQFTPVTTLLLLDSSSSIRSSLSAIQTAAYLFAQNLSEGDRVRVGLFNNEVTFGARFSDDLGEHLGLLRAMKPEGKTALYDAILAALEELEPIEGRKSLLVFTDGDDAGPSQGSTSTMEEAVEGGKQSLATIYTVGFKGWGPQGAESVNVPLLTSLAESTGGRAFFPKDVEEVKKAFAEVQRDLHRHYRIAYVPGRASVGGDPLWRNIEVRVKGVRKADELLVRTRQGYYSRPGTSP